MILIKNALLYSPRPEGKKDVLLCGGRVEAVADCIPEETFPCSVQVIEAEGKIMTPGIVDQHVHITGGGGEGSFHTRVPEVQFSDLVAGGVTTVVGLLGTDDVTRSVENLVAKAKALKEEGITAFALTGAYGYPPVTITGSVKKDIAFIDEILGVKLAISDHRAPNLSEEELMRLASDVRTAGMLSGKPGIVTLHMGSGRAGLSPVMKALERTEIPIKTFRPTHVSRCDRLLMEAAEFAAAGGWIDITCDSGKKHRMACALRLVGERGAGLSRVTISSDGQGSWSEYDEDGGLVRIGVSAVDGILKQLFVLVEEDGMELSEALLLATENPARALALYPRKGCIREGSDADMLLFKKGLSLDTVIAGGRILMEGGSFRVRGTYE